MKTTLLETSTCMVDFSKHHCTTESMLRKNMSTSNVRRRPCETGLFSRIAVKKPLLWKQNNVKILQLTKVHKDWEKVLWTDESKFKIFQSNRRIYVWQRVGKKAATPCITPTIKHGGGSVLMERGFCQLQSRVFASCEGQIESNWLSRHTAASHDPIWNAGQGFVLMLDNNAKRISKLCQRYIKSKEE